VPPVRVRMYRQGLGDCFLLTFGAGADERHVLIDCGTLGATTNANKMETVVDHIRQSTNGHLHAMVATHEHKDHLSGFSTGDDVFKNNMTIDRFWVAWTENPADQLAQDLKKYDEDLGLAASMGIRAIRRYIAQETPSTKELEPVVPRDLLDQLDRLATKAEHVLSFFGDDVLAANVFAPTIHAAMELVRTGFGTSEAKYLHPGTLVDVDDWLPGFRVYVLGPPRSKQAIDDTGEEGGGDLYPYPIGGITAAAQAFMNAASREDYLAQLNPLERDEFSKEVPFDQRFQRSARPAAGNRLPYPAYDAAENAWRRVDSDWLQFSSILTLQLDNRTNNTSLVLAFERIADGKVLLFPADAQRGNWQSWSTPTELTWTVTDGAGAQQTVTTGDLLKRTVFYKVGHHSSHNATARENGLEKMEQNTLVAFIPLDRQVAQNKGWNTMPTRALYKRLMEKCNGRVVRSDIGWVKKGAETGSDPAHFDGMFLVAEWQSFSDEQQSVQTAGTVKIDPLFIDYELK
jgi:hypothetical protein